MTLPGYNETMYIRALVGGQSANPSFIFLIPRVMMEEPFFVGWGSQSYNFVMPSVSPGTYNVKIQCCVQNDEVNVASRTLSVIAFSSQS
jgi:hypothetical protein